MKIQNLSIIFLIIIIPLIMILSYYLDLQQDTLKLQAEYDTKLAQATKEGIKAFEVNTVDWSEWVKEKTRLTERDDARAAINTFVTSLANNLNLSGTAKEYMVNYIPAVAVTMYDGYYVYAPNYVPVSKVNNERKPLYLDAVTGVITTDDGEGKNKPIYEPKDGVTRESEEYTYIEEGNLKKELIDFVTDIDKAKMEYKHILSSQIAYIERYAKDNTNVVVNYTLDNRIYVYGTVDGNNIQKDGYLVYFNNDTVMPRIKIGSNAQDDSDIEIIKGVDDTVYQNQEIKTEVKPEILEEQLIYWENGQYNLGTFKYIYNIEHEKLYYDEEKQDFFEFLEGKQRQFINESNHSVEYKSVSVLLEQGETVDYRKIYQALNGKHKGQWYINLKTDSEEAKNEGKEEIDTRIEGIKLQELGLKEDISTLEICKDYSAINYYVEAYEFTNWARKNLDEANVVVEGNIENIFNITSTNDPEKETSPIVIHKEEIMKNHIITNLNLAISNYSMGTYEYRIPQLTERDWEQVFNNISMITFFQGIQIGLKYYNNYAIATSSVNREYVDPEEIYLSGEDENYHIAYCEKCENTDYTGYRSVEYVLKEYGVTDTENIYYYQHDNLMDDYSEKACYYCVVNKENYKETEDRNKEEKQTQAYNEALARERYYQKELLAEKIGVMITYDYNIAGWDDIIHKEGLPAEQEVEIGAYATIASSIPKIISSNQFVKYVFVGWADSPNSTDIKYMPGDKDIFYEDTTLYAIWRISLSELPWKVDYLWNSATNGFESGTCNEKGQWTGVWAAGVHDENSISYILIDETSGGSRVQMVGNSELSGKGATWATFDSEFLDIAEFKFDYTINKGDSFNAGGFMFNVIETDTTLEGYMLSINFKGEFQNLSRTNGAIYKFKYNKGNSIGNPANNKINVEEIERVQALDIGGYDDDRGSSGTGTITIEVTPTGYNVKCTELSQDYFIPVNNVQPNKFGFFSDHYSHDCPQIGYFKLDNIKVTVVRDK